MVVLSLFIYCEEFVTFPCVSFFFFSLTNCAKILCFDLFEAHQVALGYDSTATWAVDLNIASLWRFLCRAPVDGYLKKNYYYIICSWKPAICCISYCRWLSPWVGSWEGSSALLPATFSYSVVVDWSWPKLFLWYHCKHSIVFLIPWRSCCFSWGTKLWISSF